MPVCAACAALEGAAASTAPHASLLLYSQAEINYGATASGQATYYVCNTCGACWERDVARSEPDAVWKHADKPLR